VLAAPAVDYYKNGQPHQRMPPLTFDAPDAGDRIAAYLNHVTDNGTFYGVYRRDAVKGMTLGEDFGSDWRFMAEIASKGPILGVETTALHRGLEGMSSNIRPLILRTVPAPLRVRPHSWTALQTFRQICFDETSFVSLTAAERPLVATRAAGILLRRFCKPAGYYRGKRILARLRSAVAGA